MINGEKSLFREKCLMQILLYQQAVPYGQFPVGHSSQFRIMSYYNESFPEPVAQFEKKAV